MNRENYMRLTAIIAASAAIIAAVPAQAELLTYSFETVGSGYSFGYPGAADPFTAVFLNNATFRFTVDTASIFPDGFGNSELGGTGVTGTATASSISLSANQSIGSELFSGGASVCFSNPSATFLLASASVGSTCQSKISATGFGSTNGMFEYNGFVTGLTVTSGGAGLITQVVNGVPEPSTWALMLAGFAMTGYALRRRKVAFA